MRWTVCVPGGSGTLEWTMVELQGVLDGVTEYSARRLGKLTVNDDNSATLIIGSHLLEGSVVTLKHPLAAMKRVRTGTLATETSFEIVGVIRRKIYFPHHPQPLSNDDGAESEAANPKRRKLLMP
ncbi:uncharacterized protein AMSG_01718 [Thecamonas trahens ATCC 50062]|uniref:Chromosome transmission fidelity protein 8 n=1 Tax=Thecamonas trahens ATCC 50062 TaxID=461836 RepID=A0A0L0DTA9_THETB|nr:hypothetical protein AMSG_01718 [Thecamonas trahens ATCC 50062]KNC55457.1 hypothetical protein AMSG_01718 [Thecamonas trahens ATCC 50062]|eukprot:XP_013761239.1 hypothetical protein AMSG_01718 [Thecamonas trahens ATCC 50062]